MNTLNPTPTEHGFAFETEAMAGCIQPDGVYHGVTRLTDKRTGRQLIDPRYSALNLYRLFSTNQAMGQPRRMPRKSKVGANFVEVTWPPTDAYQGEIIARYEVVPPNAIDLTLTVRSKGTYPQYEIFAPSYFDKELRPHIYLKPPAYGRSTGGPELTIPTVNEIFRGTVVVFPRDAHAVRACVDGRWDRSEFSSDIVQMCPVRHYAHCFAFVADPANKLAVVLMSHPRDAYAISTRYHADQEIDRLVPYSAFEIGRAHV